MDKIVFSKPKLLNDTPMHYCPGCTHGIVHRLIAEALEEVGETENVVGIAPVGCAVFAYNYFTCDMFQASHGRAPSVATGVKRANPDALVFAYQGDGDLASIGMAEIVHAATRGENFTVIFINNGIYGMTGGQMAPTTLPGQKTTTSPMGRNPLEHGNPIKICEMLSTLTGPAYIARTSVFNVKEIKNTKAAMVKAFKMQKDKRGFSLIEILSTCPTNFHLKPQDALDWIKDVGVKAYPLGVYKDIERTHIEALIDLANGVGGRQVNLPFGFVATNDYDFVTLEQATDCDVSDFAIPFAVGQTRTPLGVVTVSKTPLSNALKFDLNALPKNAVFRNKLQGDSFTKFGGGSKPLKKYLIDKKIPQRQRQNLLLVAEGNEVYVICGVEISDKVRVTEKSDTYYIKIAEDIN